jgi:hypothetical protein
MGHNINNKFDEIWLSHSKIDRGYTEHREHGDHISLLLFLKNKESRLKRYNVILC